MTRASRERLVTAAVWLLLGAVLVAAFGASFSAMWARWFPAWNSRQLSLYGRIVEGESYYTHGPLMPLVSLVMIILLVRHTSMPVRPSRVVGPVVLALSLTAHVMGSLARVNFVSSFAFVGVLVGLVLMLWGRPALRRLWFALALLTFMVPLPEVTIADLNFRLKMLAADLGVKLTGLLGVIVERDGNRAVMEGGKSLVIANVCNGLRTLISLLAFGALYAYVCRLRGSWRIGLFAMTVPIAVVANAARVVGLILAAHVWDEKLATGWFHDASGLAIFMLAFLLMFGLERLVLWLRAKAGRPAKVTPLFAGQLRTELDDGQFARLVRAAYSTRAMAALAGLAIAAVAVGCLGQARIPSRGGLAAASAVPTTLHADGQVWTGYEKGLDQRTLTVLETDDYLYRLYVPAAMSAPPVHYCVIFSQDNRKSTHPPDLCLEGGGNDIIHKNDLMVSGVPCRELLVQTGPELHYYLYTYKYGSGYTRSFWRQQLAVFANSLLQRPHAGALIRVSTLVAPSEDLTSARQRCGGFVQATLEHLGRLP